MLRASRSHLTQAGESYFEHMRFALIVGLLAVGAGLACVLHAFVPGVCQTTCSRTIALLQELFADRGQLPAVADQSSGVTTFTGLVLLSSSAGLLLLAVGAGAAFTLVVAVQAYALPLVYIAQNPALDPD